MWQGETQISSPSATLSHFHFRILSIHWGHLFSPTSLPMSSSSQWFLVTLQILTQALHCSSQNTQIVIFKFNNWSPLFGCRRCWFCSRTTSRDEVSYLSDYFLLLLKFFSGSDYLKYVSLIWYIKLENWQMVKWLIN